MSTAAELFGYTCDIDVGFRAQADTVLVRPDLAHVDHREHIACGEWNIYKSVVVTVNRGGTFTHGECLTEHRDLTRFVALHRTKHLPHQLNSRPGIIVIDRFGDIGRLCPCLYQLRSDLQRAFCRVRKMKRTRVGDERHVNAFGDLARDPTADGLT